MKLRLYYSKLKYFKAYNIRVFPIQIVLSNKVWNFKSNFGRLLSILGQFGKLRLDDVQVSLAICFVFPFLIWTIIRYLCLKQNEYIGWNYLDTFVCILQNMLGLSTLPFEHLNLRSLFRDSTAFGETIFLFAS